MDEKRSYLHTTQYQPRRRGCGCVGFGALILLFLLASGLFSQISFPSGMHVPVFGHTVGIIRIEGPINESRDAVKVLRSFRKSPLIKAVVLRLDTPGGAVGASEEIYREVMRIRKEGKHVVSSMGNAAASGGYYIAAGSEEIFANAGTLTGSIGVIAMDWNVEETLRKLGIRSEVLKSGEHKDTGSPFRDMTPEDRRVLQNVVYDVYRQFFGTVLRSRHKQIDKALAANPNIVDEVLATSETKRAELALELQAFTTGTVAAEVGASEASENALRGMADGRVISGYQAQKLGLVDHIGTLDDAVSRAGELAGIGKEPSTVERSPDSRIPSLLGGTARKVWEQIAHSEPVVQLRRDLP